MKIKQSEDSTYLQYQPGKLIKPGEYYFEPVGRGGGGTWVNVYWVCAPGLSEPLPYCSPTFRPVINPILGPVHTEIA